MLSRAIDSVLNQDYPNLQLFVFDDGSIDETQKVLAKYDSVENLAYMIQTSPASGGAARGRNIGLAVTNTEYVAFLDSDDRILPDKLRIQMERMLADAAKFDNLPAALRDIMPYSTHNEIDICYTRMTLIYPDGTRKPTGNILSSFYGFVPNIVIPNMEGDIGTTFTTGLIRKEIFRLLGGFKNITIGEDSEYKDRMFAFGCNESFENKELYEYYLESPHSKMESLKSESGEQKAARASDEAEYANYKREMKLCADKESFITKFSVTIEAEEMKIVKTHNSSILELDKSLPVEKTTRDLLEQVLAAN
ncbi:MAG: glycosyltransferase [Proteobacteria bacterium]|nr:glycosyltransferase [Pseudomonadota bacterium]